MRRLTTAACMAALLALGLTACGGGADVSNREPEVKPTWALAGDSTGDCWSVGIERCPDGTFAIIGGFHGTTVLAPGTPFETTLVGEDASDIFLARITPLGELLWARSIVGAEFTEVRGLDVGADGSLYVCGYFFGTATFAPGEMEETTLATADGEDGFLARYDGNGRLLWVRQVASGSVDELHDVAVLPDGAVAVAGLFADELTLGSGELNETMLEPAGWIEALVACYEADGSLRWARGTSTVGYAGGWGVAAMADGGIGLCGDYTGMASFGTGATTSVASVGGTSDMFVARYHADGHLLWVRTEGGADEDYATGLRAAPDGGVRLLGMFAAEATFGSDGVTPTALTSAGKHDGVCAAYDASGALTWSTQLSGPDHDETLEARVLADGTTLILGTFVGKVAVGEGDPTETILRAGDGVDREVVLAQYGADGALLWATALGGAGDDTAVGFVPMPDGTYVVVGSFMDELLVRDDPLLVGVPTKACAFFTRVALGE